MCVWRVGIPARDPEIERSGKTGKNDDDSKRSPSTPADFQQAKRGREDGEAEWGEEAAGGAESGTERSGNHAAFPVPLGNVGSPCLQIHQHRRLTRAQSHHGSDEERKRRKILARKVGS